MDIPILVEPLPNNRFRARCGEPFSLSAEGATHASAVESLRASLSAKLANGWQLDVIRLPDAAENPWITGAGHLKDDPFFDEWLAEIDQIRATSDVVGPN